MKKLIFIFLIVLQVSGLYSQDAKETIQKLAIDCKDWSAPNQDLYAVLKDYNFICIGEMHGTKEPAEFLTGLVKSFVANTRKVIVGMEIPENSMRYFTKHRDSLSLSNCRFFSNETMDGRASEAWFRAMNDCNKIGVQFCFFDNSDDNRDLTMYKNILKCYQADTDVVVITLSGNVHTKIIPYNKLKTMACYLKEKFGNKMCSINHIYNGGTMYNKTFEGLKTHTVEANNSIFSTATDYTSYYLPNVFTLEDYSGFFFTRIVTASLPRVK